MKKIYETPSVEKVAFQYRDQVVAASAGGYNDCLNRYGINSSQDCKLIYSQNKD